MSTFMVYEPRYRSKINSLHIWLNSFKKIFHHRDLLFYLIKRDFLADYKRSFLSIGWLFISPALGVLSWIIINYANVLNPGKLSIPYPAYVLVSTMIWGLFMSIYQNTSNLFFNSVSFGIDVPYYREVLMAKQIVLQVINFVVGFVFIEAVLLYYHIYPTWQVLVFPLVLLPLILLGTGIGLVISIYSVVLPDFKKWIDYVMQLLMFVTPVIYSPQVGSDIMRKMIYYNPLSYLIQWIRVSLIGGSFDEPLKFCLSSLGALIIFLFGLRLFYLTEDMVIEKIY